MGFVIDFELLALPPITIPDTDLASLLMNLLDNALESCSHIESPENRWIKVRLKTRKPYLCFSIANASQGVLSKSGDSYISTKDDHMFHGHGIETVRNIASKHGGLSSFEHSTDTFTAEVALPVE
jgi:sensor histidine kinase regulating citrate/malate metabolism